MLNNTYIKYDQKRLATCGPGFSRTRTTQESLYGMLHPMLLTNLEECLSLFLTGHIPCQ